MTITLTTTVTVALIDAHEVVTRGLRADFARAGQPIEVRGTFHDVRRFLRADLTVDVVVLDLDLREASALSWIGLLVQRGHRVLLYTAEQRPVPLRAAVAAGVSGVLLKSDPLRTVADAILGASAGDFVASGPLAITLVTDPALVTELSEQQLGVLRGIDQGLDRRAVARLQNIGQSTVKEYLTRVREKYRAKGVYAGNSHHLTKMARDEGYL